MHIDDLPIEIILQIFTYLPQPFIVSTLKQVSKRWMEVAKAPILWRSLDLYHQGQFLSMPHDHLKHILQEIGGEIYHLRTKITYFSTKFSPEIFTGLKGLHLRMYDDSSFEQLQQVLLCHPDLEAFKLDVTKFERLTEVISLCKRLKNLKCFHLRHFFCHHSTTLKLMSHMFQVLFQNTTMLTHVTLNCGDIFLDSAIQTLLEKNRDLKELNLNRCTGITNTAFLHLRPCNLQTLLINGTAIDDETLRRVADNMPYLKQLSVLKCKNITDKGMLYISKKCKLLQHLSINDLTSNGCCQVSNLGVGYIADGCRDLQHLNANLHPHVDVQILMQVGILCTHIKTLQLESLSEVNDSALIGLAQHCKLLEHVRFFNCSKITGIGVSHLIVGCRWLKQANFSSCMSICDMDLDAVYKMYFPKGDDCVENESKMGLNIHSHVQLLNFARCHNMKPESLVQISNYCLDLNELHITGWANENVDLGIIEVLKNCKNLHYLGCFGNNEETNFTNDALEAMAEFGKQLKQLHFSLNIHITPDGLNKVISSCTKLEKMEVYVNDSTNLSFLDIENVISGFDSEKISCQSYTRLSATGCIIIINQL